MSIVRLLPSVVFLACEMVLGQTSISTKPPRDSRVNQDFRNASGNFKISPYGMESEHRIREGDRYSERRYGFDQVHPPPEPALGNATPAAIDIPAAGVPVSLGLDQSFTGRIAIATAKGILFLALSSIAAKLIPRRVWDEIVDGGNLPLGILLSALAIALGLIIAAR